MIRLFQLLRLNRSALIGQLHLLNQLSLWSQSDRLHRLLRLLLLILSVRFALQYRLNLWSRLILSVLKHQLILSCLLNLSDLIDQLSQLNRSILWIQ